jgi:hypothetical protein
MRNKLTAQSFAELFTQLTQAKLWFNSIGIPTKGNRFDLILANVEIVQEHWNKPTLNDVLRDHQMHDLWISLLDAASIVVVHQQFKKLKSAQLPRGRLKEALGGPLMPHDEGQDGESIQARNALFELELAAFLQACGIQITNFDDIEFVFDGTTVNVQCKRLHSYARLQDNLDKACSQIANRIDNTNKKGLVAIGIDKVIGADKTVWETYDETALTRVSNDIVKKFLQTNERRFLGIVDVRVLGILVDLRIIGRIKNQNDMLTNVHERALYPLISTATQQFVDTAFIERLGRKIADSPEQLYDPDAD